MTPDEVRSHPFFEKLTDKQQTFVSELLSNGNDKIKAAQAAWVCKNEESARTLANRALRDDSIAFLVESYYGKDPARVQFTRDGALEFAAKQARETEDPKLALDYLKLIVAMNGWVYKPADAPPTPPPIDDSELPPI